MQYTEEQKKVAIKAYIANGKNAAKKVSVFMIPDTYFPWTTISLFGLPRKQMHAGRLEKR